jgi:hypothetical protein
MELILGNNTFVAPAPKARMVRKAIEITEGVNFEDMKSTDLDNLVSYIVDLFNKQFTIDDIYDNMAASELISTLTNCITGVVRTMGAKLEQFPNGQAGE